ncbi:Ninja-family protein AFP3 [Dendrobium catenatum]|uniref:Ninja-family protein n=1 Tax=Dendrobium catenatum TaxID=906689 RepID=A0A2I0WPJ5_9ASPA|nr:Ninja-family protein AFP3 [Dendrobium catenatum]
MRKAKLISGDRRRFFNPVPISMRRPVIPVMPIECTYPAVALPYVPFAMNPYVFPYVVPCWAPPVVKEGKGEVALPVAAGGDEKSSSGFLHVSGDENSIEITRGSSSSNSNETKTIKLDESYLKNKKKEMEGKMLYVTAKGDGPDGKTITGLLYRYTKVEVSIMCVCHGQSFSPAEFLGHAGNSHTSRPLRQIVVVPSPAGEKGE